MSQIVGSLGTQQEVITEPVPGLAPVLAPDLDASALAALKHRLSPPWVIMADGVRR